VLNDVPVNEVKSFSDYKNFAKNMKPAQDEPVEREHKCLFKVDMLDDKLENYLSLDDAQEFV
jgi:hypothetical protein